MKKKLLVTAIGEDRPGIVARLTEVFVKHGANLEESRMAILGGEFATIALVTVPEIEIAALEKELAALKAETISVTTKSAQPSDKERFAGHTRYQIDLKGADHEGIVHNVAKFLRDHAINIQSMDTTVIFAPETGTPLFQMNGIIQVPPTLKRENLQHKLDDIGGHDNVEITLTEPKKGHENALTSARH